MGEGHSTSEDRLYWLPEIELDLGPIEAQSWILDIGGGGEGVIGQLAGDQVVAIDRSERELQEAPEGPLKIVMDATQLDFLDESFQTVTCFFSLMYMPLDIHQQVFSEITRVLKSGGRCLIWDYTFPIQGDIQQPICAFKLTVNLPDQVISTGYGTRWPEAELEAKQYIQAAKEAGLELVKQDLHPPAFHLEFKKP
jgi:ubiquinone/menaquinone biosynthesis C-methylase UbiE